MRAATRDEGRGALRRGIAGVALRVTGAALSFLLTIVLARMLGADGFGTYSYAMAMATLGVMLAQVGLPVLVVRESARYRSGEQWSRLRGLLFGSSFLVAGISLLCLLIVLVVAGLAGERVAAINFGTVVPALVLIPMIAMNNVGGASLRGLGYAIKGQLAEQLIRPGLFLASLLAAALVATTHELTPPVAMTLHAGAAVGAFLFGLVLLLRAVPDVVRDARTDYGDWGRLRRSLLPFSILVGLQAINGQTDILMLGYFRDAADVGIYRVAHQCASLVNLTLFAIGLTVEPSIARLHLAGETGKLQHVVTVTARMAFGLSALMTLFLIVFGQLLLDVVFGEIYVESLAPLAILCIGQIGLAYAGWSVMMLNMSGNERVTARLTAYAAVGNVIANALLIPPFGLYGAAIATASTLFVWKLVLSLAAEEKTGIRMLVFPGKRVADGG